MTFESYESYILCLQNAGLQYSILESNKCITLSISLYKTLVSRNAQKCWGAKGHCRNTHVVCVCYLTKYWCSIKKRTTPSVSFSWKCKMCDLYLTSYVDYDHCRDTPHVPLTEFFYSAALIIDKYRSIWKRCLVLTPFVCEQSQFLSLL